MLSITEAAKRLGVPARTLRLWCRQGRVTGARQVGPNWVLPDPLPPIERPAMGRPRRVKA